MKLLGILLCGLLVAAFAGVRNDRARHKAGETSVDPATGKPVARDLRFHRFVAHQREFYFLNHTGNY